MIPQWGKRSLIPREALEDSVKQNGLTVKEDKVKEFDMKVTKDLFEDNSFIVKIGKKKIYRVVLK